MPRGSSSSRTSRASGRPTPIRTRAARSSGSSCATTAGALVRAVLEGVAFGLRDSLDLIRGLGVETPAGRASGGGARSRLWLRIVASALGLPLELTESEEGSAFGAALLGGVAAGVFPDVPTAVGRCVRVVDVVEPEPSWQEAYAELHARYGALYPALRPFSPASPKDPGA